MALKPLIAGMSQSGAAGGAGSGTVTNTGGNLTSNAVVLGAGGADSKVVAGIITDGISQVTLGVAGASVGSVVFKNATSGAITLSPPTGALGTPALTWGTQTGVILAIGSGTSGGIPYFNGTTGTSLTSSGALALNSIVLGGGAGNAPISTTTGAGVVNALGQSTNSTGGLVVYGGTVNLNINGTVGAGTPGTGAFTTLSSTGINSFTGATVTPATAMAALVIDVTKADNTKTISADSTFTFSGTPATANTYFAMEVTNSAGVTKTLTIPSSWSMGQQGAITSVIIPANGILFLEWFYDGSLYKLNGDPPLTLNAGTSFLTGGTETTVASATITDLGAVASNKVSITGTVTITGLGTIAAGTEKQGRFTGILTLTHNATSLILPSAANITTAAGDRFIAYSLGSGNWVVISYIKASGAALVGSSSLTSTQVGYGDGSNLLTGEAAFIYTAASNILTVGGVTLGAGSEVSTIGPLVDSVDGTTPLHNAIAAYAAGTVYVLTNTSAAVDFGTTDPLVTIANAGTYLLFGRVVLKYSGATFVANRTVTLKLRRTNNTAADIANSTTTLTTGVVTTFTSTFLECSFPPVPYVTTNTTDTVTIYADVDTVPSAGSLDASSASLVAQRLY